ncbi:MAG: hypothetical protein N3F08_02040 [Crenarchaeota archaeon]|nr:hypothetical protein [Thermoproteota archaeon]
MSIPLAVSYRFRIRCKEITSQSPQCSTPCFSTHGVEAAYEQLRHELGDEEAEKEVENARKYLEKHARGLGVSVSWEDAVLYVVAERAKIKKETENG